MSRGPIRRNQEPPMPPWIAAVLISVWIAALCSEVCRGADRPNPYPYERPSWGRGIPGNDRDVRAEVLVDRCRVLAWNSDKSVVILAESRDAYSGKIETRAGRAWSLDHLYPAARAWKSRTWRNSRGGICRRSTRCAEFQAFFDDGRNLQPTSLLANGQKADRGPAEWCPRSAEIRPVLARKWRIVAARYRLPFTEWENRGLEAWAAGTCLVGAAEVGR